MDRRLVGRILTETGWIAGTLHHAETISRIDGEPAAEPALGDGGGTIVVPGFIDLHIHGGGGADVMDGADAVRTMARTHGAFGTTSLLATTMTAPEADIVGALRGITAAMAAPDENGATVLGVHLEGPFISPDKLGAQPPATAAADLAVLGRYQGLAPLKVVTLALDMAGTEADIAAMVARLRTAGTRVQLGHSACSYEAARAAFAAGVDGTTHLFNAMSAFHHRAPGLVGAALAHAPFAELIPDLIHTHPGALRVALKAIPGLYAVTDATAAAGMPDGDYRLGRHSVRKCRNAVRLADGTLAGSCLTMVEALRNLAAVGPGLGDACRRVSTLPARYLGLDDRGRLAVGTRADAVVLTDDWQIDHVLVAGRALRH